MKKRIANKGTAILPTLRAARGTDKLFLGLNYLFLGLIVLVIFYPMWYCVICSFSDTSSVIRGDVWLLPKNFNLDAYKIVFEKTNIMQGFMNSVYYCIVGSAWAIMLTFLAAYPLSRKDLPGRNLFMVYFMIIMFFNGGIIPNYLLVLEQGMMNTRWALIIPFILSVHNVIICRTYFTQNIPHELLEASKLDGCGDVRFFISVAMPLAKPVLAVMILFHVVWRWNNYMTGLLYLNDAKLYPLQLVLRELLFVLQMSADQLGSMDHAMYDSMYDLMKLVRYSALVIGALPMMIIYPFIQKSFVKGMMIGSVKG